MKWRKNPAPTGFYFRQEKNCIFFIRKSIQPNHEIFVNLKMVIINLRKNPSKSGKIRPANKQTLKMDGPVFKNF